MSDNLIRLQKFLADNGIASRRKCEEYILAGKVTVNKTIINELGTKIDPKKDAVAFEGKEIKQNQSKRHTYILLNKPIDYVTTAKDQFRKKYSYGLNPVRCSFSASRKTRYVYIRSINFN